ncbi:unnamed protein product [Cuscuta epithymum]|uniref:Uncharacterized protein n=1 Tax=Cuscuta epithymum TaxID=186058 RepID=A0AAV0EA09_9ASTE|nr:unnamed protein product [Cuscuta epithymum]
MLNGWSSSIICSWRLCYALGALLCFLTWGGEATIKLPDGTVIPAIVAFGDSIIDQGMNNYIPAIAKCNFPPYGDDLPGGNPTGRFSNGKTAIDIIAEELGVKELVPPYLDPNLQIEDLKTGVSFASAGSGYDPLTTQNGGGISLSQQLDYFREYLKKLRNVLGENETNFITENSLLWVLSGSNDIAITYFTLGLRRLQYTIDAYTDFMVESASSFIQELYGIGTRRIGVFSQVPIGCVPAMRTLNGGNSWNCAEKQNEVAKLVNAKLSDEIDFLSKTLPGVKLVFIDLYHPLLDLIQNPGKYDFEESERGCCGTGKLEASYLCNKFSPTCKEHDKFIFWDSFHPTEACNKILVEQILPKYISHLT